MDPLAIALGLTWLLLAGCLWVVFQLMVQNGRILLRLESIEQGYPAESTDAGPDQVGLPIGSVLLDFELPLVSGGADRLSAWRGEPLLLLFIDPTCQHSRLLASALVDLPPGGPQPLLVSTGSPDSNLAAFPGAAERWPVVLQEGFEVAVLAGAAATPAGYLVDESGRTSSPLAVGLAAVRALAGLGDIGPTTAAQVGEPDFTPHQGDPVFASYGVERAGLPRGSIAPQVTFSRLDGSDCTLADYLGRPLLLVFVDPEAAECEAVLTELAARRTDSFRILAVSRGDPQRTAAWAERYDAGMEFGLQRFWSMSRAFDLVAIPVAFLIDERGTIVADAAGGFDSIVALADVAGGSQV